MASASAVGLSEEALPANYDYVIIEAYDEFPKGSNNSDVIVQTSPAKRCWDIDSFRGDKCLEEEETTHVPTRTNLIYRFDVICRLCLEEKKGLMDIFRWSDRPAVMVESLVDIKIKQDDMLPKQICANCYDVLNQCLAFKEQVASADTALRRCMDQSKEVAIKTEEEVFDESDPGIIEQQMFDSKSALHALKEGIKIEELIKEEDYTTGDEMVWEKDADLYSENKTPVGGSDDATVCLPEAKSEPVTGPNIVISSPSKGRRKSQILVKCEQCDKAFSCNSHLQEHIKSHASFCHDTDLQEHMSSHKSANEDAEKQTNSLKCANCNASYVVECDRNIHGSILPKDDKTQCHECDKSLTKTLNLERNVKKHYKDESLTQRKLIRENTNVGNITRSVSQQIFDDRNKLTNQISLDAGKKPFVCKVCGKSFGFNSKLIFHMLLHIHHARRDKGEKLHECSYCSKSFDTSSALNVHLRTHAYEKPFKCPHCSMAFANSSRLKVHLHTHIPENPYKCHHCSKLFRVPAELIKHLKTHTGENPFNCPQCSKSFTRQSHLSEHLHSHIREKPFKCPQCSKYFSRPSYFYKHVQLHKCEKPYKCEFTNCPKSFRVSAELIKHVKTHPGEKQYKCSHCSKSFFTSSALTVHIRTHTGEKRYKCAHCPNSFRVFAELSEHVKSHWP